MPKRSPTTTASTKPAAKKAKGAAEATNDEEAPTTTSLPLTKWRVVLTGDFVLKAKPLVEQALKDKGVTITSAVSGKTTHLILGNKSGVNEYGKKTGVGSSKYNQAVANKNVTIVTETEVWAILTGTVTADDLSEKKEAAKVQKKPAKSSSLSDKVLFCVQESGGGKISLPKLKKELEDRFDVKMENTRSKNALKSALTKLCDDEKKLVKEGASYRLVDVVDSAEMAAAMAKVGPWSAKDNQAVTESKIKKLCPQVGRWRGLRMMTSKKPTGKATCMACGQKIEKGSGGKQVQVSDDSLFRMVVWPEDGHEGVYRGYVECSYPGYEVIARRQFWIHEDCHDEADRLCREQFQLDWQAVRPHEIAARRG